ncbi:hypothetical protein F5Y16DRAFT_395280 [Xylariaceae sp. FL0255]|nr:hypothetical protein F5Y16DRAFT_395280 [Xylariaceae sp. FL0255]
MKKHQSSRPTQPKPTEIQWPQSVPTCQLGHKNPPAYKGKSNEPRPHLQPNAYKARDLLNSTVGSFYNLSSSQLVPRQLQARDSFRTLFAALIRLPTSKLHASIKFQPSIKTLMFYLDEYFFFGSLLNSSPQPIAKFQITTMPEYDPQNLGRTFWHSQKPYNTRIWIRKMKPGANSDQPMPLVRLVYVALHEMIHTYLITFACLAPGCKRNELNSLGAPSSRHGPTFRALEFACMVTMARWHPALRDYFSRYTQGLYVDRPSQTSEGRAADRLALDGVWGNRLPVVERPSKRILIRVLKRGDASTGGQLVDIDAERLRVHVLKYAASTYSTVADSAAVAAATTLDGGYEAERGEAHTQEKTVLLNFTEYVELKTAKKKIRLAAEDETKSTTKRKRTKSSRAQKPKPKENEDEDEDSNDEMTEDVHIYSCSTEDLDEGSCCVAKSIATESSD